ncbi:MAG: RNA 2',3'-cyclic phosphodiesterase [Oscillospiraceae bacterium]|nr:RNA 2',3'-cyclic phosphodiesterase [Oscillospiraceae bacterium]
MRLFIAIQLDPDVRKALTDAQAALREGGYRGRYSDTESLHLTLAFIGEYNDPDHVLETMEQVRFEPFPIRLGGCIGNFDDLLWAGMAQSEPLEKAVQQLRHYLADAQIPFDRKQFNPHITLLRRSQISWGSTFRFSDVVVTPAEMTVRRISLMRSEFIRHGAVYTELGAVQAQ